MRKTFSSVKLIFSILIPSCLTGCSTVQSQKGDGGPELVFAIYRVKPGAEHDAGMRLEAMREPRGPRNRKHGGHEARIRNEQSAAGKRDTHGQLPEARRAHDTHLAESGATGDALKEFVDVINSDGGKIIQKTYSFDKVSLNLYLPKFSSQASRLVGVTLTGTSTFITRDASGNVVSQSSTPYAKSWGLDTSGTGRPVIINDYTDLAPAP